MLKKLWVFGALICVLQQVNAQKKQDVYYYKNNGQLVSDKDSADFIRIIQEPDSGETNFNLIEIYPDGKKKAIGKVSSVLFSMPVYEGQYLSYHKNGKKESTLFYERNNLTGQAYYFFENGTLRQIIEHKKSETNGPAKILVNYQADSLGHVMVKDGNGHVLEHTSSFNGATIEGDYKDGFKQGTWIMKADMGDKGYKEQYESGQFISGESEENGVRYSYSAIESLPIPKGGMQRFYSYLKGTMKYPADARKNNIQGKVYISFVVDKDGSLDDIKVERKLYPSMDAEALRIIRLSGKWMPGMQHGFPVRVKYSIPISFSL
ncbi:energy transducer TonB [Pedobacter africanus]|uniref:TonB family C-terminal domain-containing protein n=1 Tax=Pedobacter africanus TaxID=151894 RepID=A0A1W1ZIF0_9SPHI|nr:energy transducer TonB [Pedobacter africanus]SMC48300.1 TonB family C-terminal domain-containing protein [Pedobacter africanus]